MLIVRPIQLDDYPALHDLAVASGHGFTSLPVNEELLRARIARSTRSFAEQVDTPGDQGYLFALEDTELGRVIGVSGLEAAVGLEDAFYHYRVSKVVHSSRELNVYNTAEVLTLCNDYTGDTELCTLFLKPEHRVPNAGKLLSKVRFLFMAEHRERFADIVFAEMRGISDENGQSPFWAWLQENFFNMDFPTADYLTGIGQKVFIAELMPKYPVYVSLLSPEAQAVIGKVHENTKPALRLLENEGFHNRGYVDIFDAGPTVENNIGNIKSVRSSQNVTVKIADSNAGEQALLVANSSVENFRATVLQGSIDDDRAVSLTSEQAGHLLVSAGDKLRILDLALVK